MAHNETATQPETPGTSEPQGDRGQGHKTWTPDLGEQGISNRPDDEASAVPESDEADDAAAFGSDADEDDDVDDEDDDEEEEEEEEEEA